MISSLVLLVILCIAIDQVTWSTASISILADTDDTLQVMDAKLIAKINQVERNLEIKLEEDKENLNGRLDILEAKIQTMENRLSHIIGTGGAIFPTPPGGKTEALKMQFDDISNKIHTLELRLNSTEAGVSPEELNDNKSSMERQLSIFRRQLDDITRELKTENTQLSQILSQQVKELQATVQALQLAARLKKREENVAKIRAAFASNNMTYAKKCVNDIDDDLDGAMPEIIKNTYGNNLSKFDAVLTFFQYLSAMQRQAGITRLAEAMKRSKQVDTTQYVRLAQLAKKEFATELKNVFPISLQGMVWSQHLCLQGRNSGGYLMAKETSYTPNGYNVFTTQPPKPVKSSFCKWKFIAVNKQTSYFIAFQYKGDIIKKYWDLSVKSNEVYAKELTSVDQGLASSSDFNWQVSTVRNGQAVVLKSLASPTRYVCNPKGSASEKRVIISASLTPECEWFVNSL